MLVCRGLVREVGAFNHVKDASNNNNNKAFAICIHMASSAEYLQLQFNYLVPFGCWPARNISTFRSRRRLPRRAATA